MKHPLGPYIGLRGFRNHREVECLLDESKELARTPLMVGVIMTPQTIMARVGPHWPYACIQPEQVPGVFPLARTLNLVHIDAPDSAELFGLLQMAYLTGGQNCHGVQVNIPWPEQAPLNEFRAKHPDAVIAIEVGESARLACDNRPGMVGARFFANYAGVADYFVLSMNGAEFRSDPLMSAEPYLDDIMSRDMSNGKFKPVIATKMASSDVIFLDRLFAHFPNLSIDGERGCLREDGFLDTHAAVLFSDAVGESKLLGDGPGGW